MDELYSQARSFLNKIFQYINIDNINIDNYTLDHICFRAESNDTYDNIKKLLLGVGTIKSENYIRERKISVFELLKPITFNDISVNCIELSSPRKDLHFIEGFEHAEFVIPETLEQFLFKYPSIEFNKEAITKEINPEIIRQYDKCAAKFHRKALLDVV